MDRLPARTAGQSATAAIRCTILALAPAVAGLAAHAQTGPASPGAAIAAAAPGEMPAQGPRPAQSVAIDLEGCGLRQSLRTTLPSEDGSVAASQVLMVDLRDVQPGGVIALANPGDAYVTVNFLLTAAARAEMQAAAQARAAAVDSLEGGDAVSAFNDRALAGAFGDRLARSHAVQIMDDGAGQVFPLTAPPRLILDAEAAQPALDALYALHTGDCTPAQADLDAG